MLETLYERVEKIYYSHVEEVINHSSTLFLAACYFQQTN